MLNKYSGNAWPSEEQTQLLRACLLSGRPAQEAWKIWKARINFDEVDFASYKLLPLVARNRDLESPRDPIFEKCKGIYRRNWVSNQLNWKKLLPILAQIKEAGVNQIVLLKGMAMILCFYRDFGVRVIGDVDILIKREKLPLAAPFLRGTGWQQTVSRIDEENPEHLRRWHALNFTHSTGLHLDLHWSFIQENSPALDEAVLRDAIPLENCGLHVPNPTDLLLQTCIHGVKYSPVPLIRWIADAMTIIKKSEQTIQWDRFIELANYAHICRPLYFALQYLVQHFDAPIPQSAILKLKAHPRARLERLEYQFGTRGLPEVAAWYRYCLNKGYLTRKERLLHLHKYLQLTARLKSPWYIPPFALYWIFKRIYRYLYRCIKGSFGLFLLVAISPLLHATADLPSIARVMQTQLADKILPYWFDTAQDTKRGGYLLNDHEIHGQRRPIEKQIVTQSRMIWAFSHAHLAGFSNRNYLQAAKQGYRFLLNHFLDRRNGGYFWSTNLKGKVLNDSKFLYGEAFVIYAFVEYYRASLDPDALYQALELYRTVYLHLHDEKNGGWFELAKRDWTFLPPEDPQNQFEGIYCKSANAHLHWMEALTELYDVSHDLQVKESLIEALKLNQTYFFSENPARYAACRQFDWKIETDSRYSEVPYGHNVEFAWLMIRAESILNQNLSWNHFYALLDHALKYGYDEKNGGLYNRGLGDQPAHDTEKIWWVQAEMLAALTDALEHQNDPRYQLALDKLLHFIQTYQASPKDGIWLSSVTADGQPKNGSKADSWKANYHDVRAMLKFVKAFASEK